MRSIFPETILTQAEKHLLFLAESNKACQNALTIIKNYDFRTYYHSVGVAQLIAAIVQRSDLVENETVAVHMVTAGFEHDLGKTMVAKEIVDSTTIYNQNEWSQMKHHPIGSFILSLASHPEQPLIPSLGLRHQTLQTGFDNFGESRSYPNEEDVEILEKHYIGTQVDAKLRAIGTVILAVADQVEARMPIPRLNSHPYGDRAEDKPADITEKIYSEFARSPRLEVKPEKIRKALSVAKLIMEQTIEYHQDKKLS